MVEAERLLGHEFTDKKLLMRSLTHASTVDERLDSNERLEFLGDAVLGLVVCEHLFNQYDELLEGEMTKIKSSVVSRTVCAEIAGEMGFDELLRLGKGMGHHADLPGSVVAAVYESVIGALYLDAGLDKARQFILKGLKHRIVSVERSGHQHNFKSVLQHIAQQMLDASPQYLMLDEQGPDHAKCFEVCVGIGARRFPSAWGPSKKQAEQQAALNALMDLGAAHLDDDGEVLVADVTAPTFTLDDPLTRSVENLVVDD
jgi:ribonuclease-3